MSPSLRRRLVVALRRALVWWRPDGRAALEAEIAALEAEIAGLHCEAMRRDQELVALQERVAAASYADSEYRHLSTRGPYIGAAYRWFAQSWSTFALLSDPHGGEGTRRAPPRELPEDLRRAFAMDGAVPVLDAYHGGGDHRDREVRFTENQVAAVERWLGLAAPGRDADDAPPAFDQARLLLAVRRDPIHAAIADHVPAGATVAIYGSVAPVYETLCLHRGARPTSIGLGPIHSDCPPIAVATLDDVRAAGRRFGRVIAGWAIGQAGMGRFDEPAPDGDLALMDRLWALVAPGGCLIAGLPTGPDLVAYNLARVYGPRRLPRLLADRAVIARLDDRDGADDTAPGLTAFVLRRPEPRA